jgi:biotin transporter BioY
LKDLKINHPVLQIIIAVIFIAFFAQIAFKVPINKDGIPVTGQTFAVLLVGFFLGPKKGALAVVFYLIVGALGVPVFANQSGGIDTFSDDSAGFLIGFIFGAAITGYFGEIGWGNTFSMCFLGMVIGTLLITAFGVAFLTYRYNFSIALSAGFYPYIWGAIIKTLIGATIPPVYHNIINVE